MENNSVIQFPSHFPRTMKTTSDGILIREYKQLQSHYNCLVSIDSINYVYNVYQYLKRTSLQDGVQYSYSVCWYYGGLSPLCSGNAKYFMSFVQVVTVTVYNFRDNYFYVSGNVSPRMTPKEYAMERNKPRPYIYKLSYLQTYLSDFFSYHNAIINILIKIYYKYIILMMYQQVYRL